MDIKIVVATHKKYRMPEDDIYIPLQVGKKNNKNFGYCGDNTGDNISEKNPYYCELTAMYWAWKNLNCDYFGLVHYRRYFAAHSRNVGLFRKKWDSIMDSDSAAKYLSHYDAILPKKRHYWIETLISHYEHTHYLQDLLKAKRVIRVFYPEYLDSFDRVMQRRSAHMFNMFIMKKSIFKSYAEWLFGVLSKLEREIDVSQYSPYEARVFGYISELLLDVWLDKNAVNYIEKPVLFMEKQHWFRKIALFLKNKFLPKKQKKELATVTTIHKVNKPVDTYKYNNLP